MMMNIKELLDAPEGEHYEFKTAENSFEFDKLAKYASALSNRGGGKIIFGVSDKRPRLVVGSRAFLQPERTRNGLIEKLHIDVSFEIGDVDGKRILVFSIAARPLGLPVQFEGVAYWREGDSLISLPEDIRRKIYAESGHDFSGDICPHATMDSLDENAIERFREIWIRKSGNTRLKTLSQYQLLEDCDVVSDEGITNAALILFGKKEALGKNLAQAEIVFEYRSSNASGPAQQRENLRDAFFNIYDRLWELVNLRNDRQHYQDGLFVFDVPTFNERATRELLLNAVCHRDYQNPGSVFVVQYRDRLTVKSPGGFLPGITPQNVLSKQAARNRRIAEVLARCGLVERSGQGMNLIYEENIKEAKSCPDFSGTDAYEVWVTLNGIVTDKNLLLFINKVGAETLESFSTQDFLLLDGLSREGKIKGELKAYAKRLLELGVIEKVGRDKYIMSRRYYAGSGKSGVHTRMAGLDRETNKALLLKHIERQGKIGATALEFQQVLPALTKSEIRTLLNSLRSNNKIECRGKNKGSRWFLV